MKTTITVHIPQDSEIVVGVGDKVENDTAIIIVKKSSQETILNLSKLLGVKPQKISQYIKRQMGEKLAKDEIIAEKKSFLSSTFVKSPAEGMIGEINLSVGSLTYILHSQEKKKIYPPFAGIVKHIREGAVDIECEANEFDAIECSGKRVSGWLRHIVGEDVGVLAVEGNVEGSILLIHNTTRAALAKMDAMDVKGIISSNALEDVVIPYALVSKAVFGKLAEDAGRTAILDPGNKKIYILTK